MNSRERLRLTINHKEADHVPFDLGASVLTGIHHKAYRGLQSQLGLPQGAPRILDILQKIAVVEDDLRQSLRVEVRGFPHALPRPLAPRSKKCLVIATYMMNGASAGAYRDRRRRENLKINI